MSFRLPRQRRCRFLPLALAVVLTGCESHRRVELTLPPQEHKPAAGKLSSHKLTLRFTPIQDRRLDAQALGSLGATTFSTTEVLPWLDQALGSLDSATPAGGNVEANASPAIIVHPTLLKFYVDALAITKTAVVVIQLDFELPGNRTARQIYRGQYAGMNWASGSDEVTTALRLALDDCLQKINRSMETWEPQLRAGFATPRNNESGKSEPLNPAAAATPAS